ncbi:MAG: hypothetical protein ACOVNU_05895 [Candidatus Kapaibacteriota bacterium]
MNTNQTEAYDWICRIIDTCTHQFHFDAIDRLVTLYSEIYKDDESIYSLKMIAAQKYNAIHNILI